MSARVYTCREVVALAAAAGFTDLQTFGSLARAISNRIGATDRDRNQAPGLAGRSAARTL